MTDDECLNCGKLRYHTEDEMIKRFKDILDNNEITQVVDNGLGVIVKFKSGGWISLPKKYWRIIKGDCFTGGRP